MPVGDNAPHNVAIAESYTLMRNGNLQQTGRSLDFALMGNGFSGTGRRSDIEHP